MSDNSLKTRIARIEAQTNNEHLVAKELLDLVSKVIYDDEPLTPAQSQAIQEARNRLVQVIQDKPHPIYMDIFLDFAAIVLRETKVDTDTDAVFDETSSKMRSEIERRAS